MSDTKQGKSVLPEDERPIVLSVDHVAKYFRLPTEQATGLKMAFLNWTKGIKGYKEQRVLRDISFDVRQGDFFGIVGRNGSGKSTLLKIISQIYKPEKGTVTVHGKLVPFIELGVGFNPELTGRENVYLNGALLGFTHEEIDAMYDDIVEFAELGDFMDQKLKNYSSGMQVRLAFSVAIKAQGDILVLDEVLAVGDEAFQRKCDNFFSEIKRDPSKTVILVTHDMDAVKKYCNKAILIKDGEIIVDGSKDEAADRYTLENLKSEDRSQDQPDNTEETAEEEVLYPAGLSAEVPMLRVRAIDKQVVSRDEGFSFELEYEYQGFNHIYTNLTLNDRARGGRIFAERFRLPKSGHHIVRFRLPMSLFNNSDFRLFASLHREVEPDNPNKDVMVAFTNDDNVCDFAVRDATGRDNYSLIGNDCMQFDILTPELAQQKPIPDFDRI